MRVSKLKIICISAIVLMVAALGLLFIPKADSIGVQAQIIEVNATNTAVENRVALNSEIDVPSSITVEYQGQQTAGNGIVVCPDGKIVNAGKMKVNQMGVYELKYYFDHSGITHTAVQKVEVYSDYFTLSNPTGGEVIVTDDVNKLYCEKDGVKVNLKSGTTFVYNKVLDLRDCDEDGLSPIIELDGRYGTFDEDGAYIPAVLEGWVRLTDCYNPNIYMELRMQKSINYTGCLFPGVKTNTQPVTGMDKGVTQVLGSSRIITLDGFPYRVWQTEGSMNVGMYNMKTPMTTGAVWKYDMQTQRVYLSYNGGENFLVSDLDEPLIYPNGNYFDGFTTGEVYVSIYANGYEKTYANTEIVSIGKDNLKDLAGKEYTDTVAPAIVVDVEKTTATGVYGAVGDTFTIPSAKAIDVNIVPGLDVAVYRAYDTNAQTNVSVVNGKFTLDHKDLYTIVYTAKDKAGNEGKEIFTVSTMQTQDNRAITLAPLQDTNVSAGTKIKNLYEITNALNTDLDGVKVEISVESEKQRVKGEGKNFSFTPYYEGAYTIRYTYTDGVFTYEKTVSLQCVKSSNVAFLDKVNVPKYYLKGYHYALEDIKAYTFTNGYPEQVATEIYAVYDDGAEVKVNNPADVEITGNTKVKFLYKAQNAETLETQEIKIINAEYKNDAGKKLGYDMTKFFLGDFTANAKNDNDKRIKQITYLSKQTSGNATLSYFNPISGRSFLLEFKIPTGGAKFESLKIGWTDKANAENKLFLELYNKEDGAYVAVNGGAPISLGTVAIENTVHTITYDYDTKFLRMGDFAAIVDFDASLVYLDLEMKGLKEKSSIVISAINNMAIEGNKYTDTIEPEIYATDFQGDYKVGDIVKISIPEFSDVVSGVNYATKRLAISCADGKPVYDKNGNALTNLVCGNEYEIKLDRIGKFYVIYEIYDFSGNPTQKRITVNCADSTAPTIQLDNLNEGETVVVKAHEEIQLNFTVSDNVTKAKDIVTYIHLYCVDMYSYVPNVTNIKPSDVPEDGVYSQKFSIPIKGNYQAQINSIDEEGNRCVKYINIIVE